MIVRLLALVCALLVPGFANAEVYPAKPVRLIVGFPPGGPTDVLARIVAESLSAKLGVQVLVENKPGAGTILAIKEVIAAAPDGYTLLFGSPNVATNETLYPNRGYEFLQSTEPVALVARGPVALYVKRGTPDEDRFQTLDSLIGFAKAHPWRLNMASPGNGTASHLIGELFQMRAGVTMTHVPYKGGSQVMPDLLAGRVSLTFDTTTLALQYVRDGRLRALGVTTKQRVSVLPDTPAIAEVLPGFEASNWWGISAPKGTPASVVARLNSAINSVLGEQEMQKKLTELGLIPAGGTPSEYGTFIAAETLKWADVIRYSGATLD